MDEQGWLTERFEAHRARLCGVAYRLLGSLSEAEDAVQEAWLRLQRADAAGVENLGGWLTTVVSRVCLDMLRARRARREEPLDGPGSPPQLVRGDGADPEGEAVLADSVGVALLVVLDTLSPAERLAFVLHDLFAVPFDEVAAIMQRSPDAAKQLASRARRRVRGSPARSDAGWARRREVVEAFLRAARAGDLQGLLAVLDPDAVIHIDAAARLDAPPSEVGQPREVRGASIWARYIVAAGPRLPLGQLAVIDGAVGLIHAPRGKLARAMTFTFAGASVTRVEVIADPARLRALAVAVL
ncbi:MAG: sigma-70 family RNA polymerase sigma factor [Deltaproteobacteria bacterium]|nr:sigma-70 family RNA polymerase sigma factor [Deltaproteobacteria bacterium]